MKERPRLVIATSNRGKLAELRRMLARLDVEVLGLRDVFDEVPEIPEEAATFEENALFKASFVAKRIGIATLADDSGLEVDALSGDPGVHSARFAGPNATDAENNAQLLEALRHLPGEPWTARFRCVLALVDPEGSAPIIKEGSCEGAITRTPRGENGFGYDPLFVLAGRDSTMAELADEEKNRISHRARALEAMLPELEARLQGRG